MAKAATTPATPKCQTCNGKGNIRNKDGSRRRCPRCGGTGYAGVQTK